MKVIFIMCITEYVTPLRKMLKKSAAFIFSELPVTGHQPSALSRPEEQGWLGRAMEGVQSHVFYSFVEDDHISGLRTQIQQFNQQFTDNHPVRCFVMNVEEYF